MAGNYWNRHDRMGPPKLTGQETVWDDLMIHFEVDALGSDAEYIK